MVHLGTGHGGVDARGVYVTAGKRGPNAPLEGYYEGWMNRRIAAALKSTLGVGAQIINDGLVNAGLKARRDCVNKIARDGDAFISIHNNALGNKWQTKASGPRVHYASKKSKGLAETVAEALGAGKPKWSPWMGVLRGVKIPAILLECSFMDSLEDVKRMRSASGFVNFVEKLASSLTPWL